MSHLLFVVGLVLFTVTSMQSVMGDGTFLLALSESVGSNLHLPMLAVYMHTPHETLRDSMHYSNSSTARSVEFGRGKQSVSLEITTIDSNLHFVFDARVAGHVSLQQSSSCLQGSPYFQIPSAFNWLLLINCNPVRFHSSICAIRGSPARGLLVGCLSCQCISWPLLSMDCLLEYLLSTGGLSEFQLSAGTLLSDLSSVDGCPLTLSCSMGLALNLFPPSLDGLSLHLPYMNGLSLYLPYLNGLMLCQPCVNGLMYYSPYFNGLDHCPLSQLVVTVNGLMIGVDFACVSPFLVSISLVPASLRMYVLIRIIKLFCLRSTMLCHDFKALLSELRWSVHCLAGAEGRALWCFRPVGLVQWFFKWLH